jgi:DDE superfamily endonuclease
LGGFKTYGLASERSTAMLLSAFLQIVLTWKLVFAQDRTFRRAQRQALGLLVCLGRRTLSRVIWTNGGQQRCWSGEYFLYSRSPWDPQQLFTPILQQALTYCPGPLVGVAVDDTRLRKTGRSIPQVSYHRDPLSPPFHTNLMLGLRFLQASILLPLHHGANQDARALPIRFEDVAVVKKPGKRAQKEDWEQYRKERKQRNLSVHCVAMMQSLFSLWRQIAGPALTLVVAGDGSLCNRPVLTGVPEGMHLIARTRKDAALCFPAPAGSRSFYGAEKFTPETVRQDETIPWLTARIFYGGQWRDIRYKEVQNVLWQGGARRRPLRLFVLAPTPYRKRKSGRFYYRQPAYLLTTLLEGHSEVLLQIYFDRWQIEVNHREEKDTLGVGQAQLWNVRSVPKQPAFAVACYSALLLASLQAFGAERGTAFAPLPKWRRHARRPSCLDLITLLRKEMVEHPEIVLPLGIDLTDRSLTAAAAA